MFSASWEPRSFWGERDWESWFYLCLWTTWGCAILDSDRCRGLLQQHCWVACDREQTDENKHHTHCFAAVTWKDHLNHCIWKATFNTHFSVPLHYQCGVMDFSMGKNVAVGLNKGKGRKCCVPHYFTSYFSPWPYLSGLWWHFSLFTYGVFAYKDKTPISTYKTPTGACLLWQSLLLTFLRVNCTGKQPCLHTTEGGGDSSPPSTKVEMKLQLARTWGTFRHVWLNIYYGDGATTKMKRSPRRREGGRWKWKTRS